MHAVARSIIDAVRHPFLVLDADLRIVFANIAFSRVFGTSLAETEGYDLFQLHGGLWNNGNLKSLLRNVISQNGSVKDYEIEITIPGGIRRVVVLDAQRAVLNNDGVPLVLASIEDITPQRQAADELLDLNEDLEIRFADRTVELEIANRKLLTANQELAATNRELEAFAYSVSHDLRTPLRALDGFSQELLLNHGSALSDQGLHYLRRIRAGTQRMGQLIDDLLTLSRVTRSEMRRECVNLTEVAASVVAELRELTPARSVTFTAEVNLTASCDPALIRVVLENLLGNAWKFTAKNSDPLITFSVQQISGRAAFVVQDDGAGFDMAYAGKLFGAFQRLHSDREFSGTGIGLATVQRIIRRHGGEVWAAGEVGRGASFYFTLPTVETES